MTDRILLAVSHGTSSRTGADAVGLLVEAVRARRGERGQGVAAAFVDVQDPDVPTALYTLGATVPGGPPVVVVPLLLSAGYHVHVDLRDAVDAARAAGGDVALAGALGPDARVVALLARRLAEAGLRADDAVVLAAAGSSDARAVADCEAVGASLSERLGRPVTVAYISAATPRLHDAVAVARQSGRAAVGRSTPEAPAGEGVGAPRVVVASYLLAPGNFADLAAAAGGDVTSAPLLVAGGPVPPELVDVVLDRFAAASS
ncbi:sirohydrochlorin chelatase [Xylanimonas ulmi]|uniref:Sirohydrochlorin ferrochelatase n=1 Tax=Xylanimonas ulmi TaxID=228973 RepID=A0A4Q7M0G3_9MICO|nr:CbiX/SirB N-terminal domain-containing protein [Xylanibacterium ulmi]RZS60834.1 sirohydrochlorin ferrochelatase [Xylanibacterium ulmi]